MLIVPKNIIGHLVAAGLFFVVASHAVAQMSPAGLWKTFDEDSGAAKSLVRITEARGEFEGHIHALLDPEDDPSAVCTQCTDVRRNQRILGLLILRNFRLADGKSGKWEGGEILDPEDGKTYRARLALSPDGRRLDVRGYIGTPLLGRTQTWQRVE
jgi:uncharacterized protein (DUF2147 family)